MLMIVFIVWRIGDLYIIYVLEVRDLDVFILEDIFIYLNLVVSIKYYFLKF